MTKEEIATVKEAAEAVGLSCSKFPKKLEIKIPKVKYPGVYFSIPTDIKSFKVQMYFHQTSFGFFDKANTLGYTTSEEALYKTIFLNEVKGIPTKEDMEQYLNQALEQAKQIGVVSVPVVPELQADEVTN